MRRYFRLCTGGAALALFAAWPAWGQTFTYSEDFNDWASMANVYGTPGVSGDTLGGIPKGWRIAVYPNQTEVQIMPQVMNTDGLFDGGVGSGFGPDCWGASVPGVSGGCYAWFWGSARQDGLGQVDYTVPWSGTPGDANHSGRFVLQHANWENFGRAASAWYTGSDNLNGGPAKHTGAYPMNLQTNSMKASFDLSVRTGSSSWCGYWPDGTNNSADGGVFAVQPVQDLSHIQEFGNWGFPLGWMGIPGFAIEFDIYPNGGDPGSAAPGDQNNHVGLDVYLKWDIEAGQVPSLQDNISGPFAASIPRMINVGDNNQPVHVTVYYNDPGHGGLGHVQVYLKVDPATKAAGDPPVPAGQTPFSFGMDLGDPPDGKLVIDSCVGSFPATNAVFGFISSSGGCNEIFSLDNMNVETDAVAPGASCDTSSWSGGFTLGDTNHPDPVNLGSPLASVPDTTSLAHPGWVITEYPALWDIFLEPGVDVTLVPPGTPDAINLFKRTIEYLSAHGYDTATPTAVNEPNINYLDVYNSTEELVPLGRQSPGVPANADNDYYGFVARGYIYFPQAGDFSLDVASDNGFELKIGGLLVLENPVGNWGNGQDQLHSGIYGGVHVSTPGVYPIQLIWEEEWGGADVEFYRRTGIPLNPFPYIGVTDANVLGFAGNSQGNGGLGDQPLIYGQLAGVTPALDVTGIDPATPPAPVVTLSPTLRVGDGTDVSGSQMFNVKVVRITLPCDDTISTYNCVQPPGSPGWNYFFGMNGGNDTAEQVSINFLDFADNQNPGATTKGINMQANGNYWNGALPFDGNEPWLAHAFSDFGIPNDSNGNDVGQFGLRFDGFAVFPAAGSYVIGLESDDASYVRFGNQTVIQQTCCISQMVALNVTQAGTYPIRVDYAAYGPQNRIKVYESVPGVGKVAVNSSLSRIKVFQNSSSGTYNYKNQAVAIPPAARVAANGQGVNPGWNATSAASPVALSGLMGAATALIENNLAALPGFTVPHAFDHPLSINVSMNDSPAGQFHTGSTVASQAVADRPITSFLLPDTTPMFPGATGTTETDNYALSFQGYIEFPQPGFYMFNTDTDDGAIMWVGGRVVTEYDFDSVAGNNTPGMIYVSTPGIYDVRVDYYQGGGGAELEISQQLPDMATRLLVNDVSGNPSPWVVKVWQGLSVAPLTTNYSNPTHLLLSDKVANINQGGDPGAHFQTVKGTYGVGWHYPSNEYWAGGGIGTGANSLETYGEMHEMLVAAFGPVPGIDPPSPPVSLDQIPGPTSDQIVPAVKFPYLTTTPPVDFTFTATRTNALLALTAGGHLLEVFSDDGAQVWVGGREIFESPSQHGAVGPPFYIFAPADGLYPITIEHLGAGGGAPPINVDGNQIVFNELEVTAPGGTPTFTREPVNTGNAIKMYVNVAPCGGSLARDDVNNDGDVDQTDFGTFQECFGVPVTGFPCRCFDNTGPGGTPDGVIDVTDYTYFMNCFSGPNVPWTTSANCPQ